MFVRRDVTETDRLRKKKRVLKGRSVQDKFKDIVQKNLELLSKIDAFNKYFDTDLKVLFTQVQEDLGRLTQTTSNEKILDSMILCGEDLDQLLDDMTHSRSMGTYDKRLNNALKFMGNFNRVAYQRDIQFYETSSSKFSDQLTAVTKDIQYKQSKMTYQVRELADEISVLEKENIRLVQSLQEIHKESFEYKEVTSKVQDYHNTIEMHQNTIKLLRKTMSAFQLLGGLFSQLSIMDEYVQHLKEDGYIRKLVKRLYRRPEELDVLDNTADLTTAIQQIKEEITDVEAIVKPAKKMVFDDIPDDVDDALIEKYKAMGQ